MSTKSSLGTSLGFPLGGADAAVPGAVTSVTTTLSPCTPTLDLHVSALGYVTSKGTTPDFGLGTNSKLDTRLAFVLGSGINLGLQKVNSVLGFAKTQASTQVHVGATLVGRVGAFATATVNYSASALGIVITSQNTPLFASARAIGATSEVTTVGFASAKIGTKILGQTLAQGYVKVAVFNITATCVGIAKARNYVDKQTISVSALGIVTTFGDCTIPLSATTEPCLDGPDGPGTGAITNCAL